MLLFLEFFVFLLVLLAIPIGYIFSIHREKRFSKNVSLVISVLRKSIDMLSREAHITQRKKGFYIIYGGLITAIFLNDLADNRQKIVIYFKNFDKERWEFIYHDNTFSCWSRGAFSSKELTKDVQVCYLTSELLTMVRTRVGLN